MCQISRTWPLVCLWEPIELHIRRYVAQVWIIQGKKDDPSYMHSEHIIVNPAKMSEIKCNGIWRLYKFISAFVLCLALVWCHSISSISLWRQMETFSTLLALCAGNWPVTGEFASQRQVTRSFDVLFDLRRNKQLSKQFRRRWFETPSCPSLRHCNDWFYSFIWSFLTKHS